MKVFFRFALIYFVVSLCVTASVRDFSVDILVEALVLAGVMSSYIVKVFCWIVPFLAVIPLMMGWRVFLGRLAPIAYAFVATVIFQVAFSFLKSAIPSIVPFYADPALARFDNWLHGGIDPWVLAHGWGAAYPVWAVIAVYLSAWAIPALALPVIIAATDAQPERRARFLILYVFCWLVVGNVLAILGSSVGPVFSDGLLGGARFAGLTQALAESGVTASYVGDVQAYLWQSYVDGNIALGSGISAFPSVHVAVSTLAALYLGERSRWLIAPGMAFVALILFLSVYTGYHYAVDGYASIILVVGAWAVLRRVRPSDVAWRAVRLGGRAAGARTVPPGMRA